MQKALAADVWLPDKQFGPNAAVLIASHHIYIANYNGLGSSVYCYLQWFRQFTLFYIAIYNGLGSSPYFI